MYACRPDPATSTARPPQHLEAPTNPDVVAVRPAGSSPPVPSTHSSECFAEPVAYDHRLVTVKPMMHGADERLFECNASAGEKARTCRFDLAREYFEANRFERAGPLLLAIAHDPTAANAPLAALLALESINVLISAANPSRYACLKLLEEETPKLLNEHCTPEPRPEAEETCAILHSIDAIFMSCSECAPRTITGRDPEVAFASAGGIYLELAQERCIFGKGQQVRNAEMRCDNWLYRAYTAFQEGHDPERAAQARAMLLDPKNGLLQSERAKQLLNEERRIEELKRDVQRTFGQSRRP